MLSITFFDHDSVKKKFPEYDADCLIEIKGKESDISPLINSLSDSFSNFWGSGSSGKMSYKIMVNDFSHFLDFVIETNDYFRNVGKIEKFVIDADSNNSGGDNDDCT